MLERRSLKWPITLGVILFVLLVVITIGWVLLSFFGAVANKGQATLYWTMLTVGSLLLALVIVGVAMYLTLSIKAINLNQRQSNFLDSVTHELKSPIASLKLYLQTLNRRSVSPEEQSKFFRYMLEDVERLDRLVNHLLVTARVQRDAASEQNEELDFEPLLRQCIEEVRLHYHVPPETFRIQIEPGMMRGRRNDVGIIFRNLIENAVKYAGDPPHIEVVSQPRPGGFIVTRVIDNGRGIPARYRHKIFGRFVRLGSELERDKPGAGLGLYIVDTLVRQMRGRVRVVESLTGEGTVFEVVLPGWTREAAVPQRPEAQPDRPVVNEIVS